MPEGVWVQGGGIELACKYFVCGPKKFKVRVKTELRKRQQTSTLADYKSLMHGIIVV